MSVGSRRALWIAIAAGVVIAGLYLLVGNRKIEPPHETARDVAPEAATARPPVPAAELEAVAGPADEAPTVPPRTGGRILHTRLPLRLLAAHVERDPSQSFAALEDLGRERTLALREGDLIPNHPLVRLTRIERDRVLLDNDGVVEKLVLFINTEPRDATADSQLGVSDEARESHRKLSERLRLLTDSGTEWREAMGYGEPAAGGVLAEAKMEPRYSEDGELLGVELSNVEPGSTIERIGLRDGDLVRSVNGVPVGDPEVTGELIGALISSDELVIEVEPLEGSESEVSVSVQELIDGLSERESEPE